MKKTQRKSLRHYADGLTPEGGTGTPEAPDTNPTEIPYSPNAIIEDEAPDPVGDTAPAPMTPDASQMIPMAVSTNIRMNIDPNSALAYIIKLNNDGTITDDQKKTVLGGGIGGKSRKSFQVVGDKLVCTYSDGTQTEIEPDGTEKATTWSILGVTMKKLYWVLAFGGVALLLAVLAIWANKK